MSVSWHADSSLVHESTIAVYCVHRGDDGAWPLLLESPEQTKKRKRREEKEAKKAAGKKHKVEGGQAQPAASGGSGLEKDKAWRVALRVVHDIEGPNSKANNDITQSKGRRRDFRDVGDDGVKTSKIDDNVTPAVVIQTNDGDAYYMLGDFNHVSTAEGTVPPGYSTAVLCSHFRAFYLPVNCRPVRDGFLRERCCVSTASPTCRARGRQLLPLHLHPSGWADGGPLLPIHPRPVPGRLEQSISKQ